METVWAFVATIVVLCVRGLLLWIFLPASLVAWLVALVVWPFARPFGVRIPVAASFYARWATQLLDALMTYPAGERREPWPWNVDIRRSRKATWLDAW